MTAHSRPDLTGLLQDFRGCPNSTQLFTKSAFEPPTCSFRFSFVQKPVPDASDPQWWGYEQVIPKPFLL